MNIPQSPFLVLKATRLGQKKGPALVAQGPQHLAQYLGALGVRLPFKILGFSGIRGGDDSISRQMVRRLLLSMNSKIYLKSLVGGSGRLCPCNV